MEGRATPGRTAMSRETRNSFTVIYDENNKFSVAYAEI